MIIYLLLPKQTYQNYLRLNKETNIYDNRTGNMNIAASGRGAKGAIIDPKDGKTKFRFDETTELKIEDFLSKVELENHFTKIADAGIKPKKRFDQNPDVNPTTNPSFFSRIPQILN